MSLYRYSTITEYTKKNLLNNELYFQTPNLFNDPYEFIFKFDVSDNSYNHFLKLIYGDKYKFFIEKGKPKKEVLEYTRDHYFGQMYQLIGAVCFTEHENNDLMWAHYGDKHRGICIEYDRKIHPFDLCRRIEYTDKVFCLSINDTVNIEEQLKIKIHEAFLRKSNLWNYEKEWRIVSEAHTLISYPPEAIKSITFGFFCGQKNKEEIYKATSHLNIDYYEIVRSKNYYWAKKQLCGNVIDNKE